MKNIKILTSATLVSLGAVLVKNNRLSAKAWFKKGHLSIVEQAFEILKNDGKSRDIKLLEAYADRILAGATVPDVKGDIDNGSGVHYYNFKNKFGFPIRQKDGYFPNRLGGYSKSAGTMLEENYYTALIFWQNGKYNSAAYLLGRSIHFLADICCPPHTTAKVCTGSPKNCHFAFETYANKLNGVYNSMTAKEFYDKFLQMTPLGIANFLSSISSGYFDKLVSKKSSDFAQITAAMVPLAQTVSAAFLYKFIIESENPKLLDENRFYTIKNCNSGLFLHKSGELDGEEEEFQPKFNSEGFVEFVNRNGEILTISGKNTAFKLTLRDENIRSFRITCGKKFNLNLAEISLLKIARPTFYKPDSELNFWRIL